MTASEGGQALVEFALVLPLLLGLALGIAELSELGVARLALEHAAAEAARAGALTNDDALIRATANAAAAPLDPAGLDIAIDPPQAARGGDPRGTLLRVRLTYPVVSAIRIVGLPPFVVHGDAVRRVEWTP
jgi:Flp pilus assembly protein TadG